MAFVPYLLALLPIRYKWHKHHNIQALPLLLVVKQTDAVYKKFWQTFKFQNIRIHIFQRMSKRKRWRLRWQGFLFNSIDLSVFAYQYSDWQILLWPSMCKLFVPLRWQTIIPQASNNLSLGMALLKQPTTTLLKTEMEGRKSSHKLCSDFAL